MEDTTALKIHMKIRVEKFDGDVEPGKAPVEVIEIEDEKEQEHGTDHSRT